MRENDCQFIPLMIEDGYVQKGAKVGLGEGRALPQPHSGLFKIALGKMINKYFELRAFFRYACG